MSYDQRPARMRVVQDPNAPGGRSGTAETAEATAEALALEGAAQADAALAAAGAAAAGRLPLLPAAMFLLACAAGGVLVAVVRPLGLG